MADSIVPFIVTIVIVYGMAFWLIDGPSEVVKSIITAASSTFCIVFGYITAQENILSSVSMFVMGIVFLCFSLNSLNSIIKRDRKS